MEGQRSRIFESDNRRRWRKNGEIKGTGSNRVAGTKKCKRCAEVFGVGKLLQKVCQRLCKDSEAIT